MSQPNPELKTSTAEIAKKWVRPLRPAAGARVRLYCIPFAGGGVAAFQAWPAALAPEIEVCPVRLPGREARFAEPGFTRMAPLADTLAKVLESESSRPDALPFAIFGHSMGALITFELCRRLSSAARSRLVHVIVSGRYSPPEPLRRAPVHRLDDEQLVDEMVRRYNAIPKEVLAVPELLELVLPTLRADMELIETYTYEPSEKLNLALSAFGGLDDEGVPRSSLEAWGEMTDGPFESHLFEGGHFFIQSHPQPVLRKVRELVLR